MKVKREAVQSNDGPGKTGSDVVGNEDLGSKAGKDETVVRRGAPQLDVQEAAAGIKITRGRKI